MWIAVRICHPQPKTKIKYEQTLSCTLSRPSSVFFFCFSFFVVWIELQTLKMLIVKVDFHPDPIIMCLPNPIEYITPIDMQHTIHKVIPYNVWFTFFHTISLLFCGALFNVGRPCRCHLQWLQQTIGFFLKLNCLLNRHCVDENHWYYVMNV